MNDENTAESSQVHAPSIWPALPAGRLDCYSRIWQLELWLREIVYVELKARYGSDWAKQITGNADRALKADSRLHYMPTRERGPLSYVSFDSLIKTISRHRRLFAPYLPVRSVWDARLEEVRQVRNRVAHFRQGHDTDLGRINQLLRDIDKGVWRFCTSYNDRHPIFPAARDKVAGRFIHLDPFPWTLTGDNALVRIGHAPSDMILSASIDMLRRPWLRSKPATQLAGKYGYLYDVHLAARQGRAFDYSNFLANTKSLHHLVCHLLLDSHGGIIRFTLPTVLGTSVIVDAVGKFIEWAGHALRPSQPILEAGRIDSLVREWPEYVLGPDNPLSFLDPGMPCTMFGAEP